MPRLYRNSERCSRGPAFEMPSCNPSSLRGAAGPLRIRNDEFVASKPNPWGGQPRANGSRRVERSRKNYNFAELHGEEAANSAGGNCRGCQERPRNTENRRVDAFRNAPAPPVLRLKERGEAMYSHSTNLKHCSRRPLRTDGFSIERTPSRNTCFLSEIPVCSVLVS